MENVISFIKNEKNINDSNIRNTNEKINYIVYQLEEIDNMIIELSKNIDTTYEIFSPNVSEKNNNVIEIEKLNLKKNELNIEKEALISFIDELEQKNNKINEALDEMKNIENQLVNNVHNTKKILEKEINKVKTDDSKNMTKMLEYQINKDNHYISDTLNKKLHLIENKFKLCENLIDIDINRAKIEMEKIKDEILSLVKKNNYETSYMNKFNNKMFHVKHNESNIKENYNKDNFLRDNNLNNILSDFINDYKNNSNCKIDYSYAGIEIFETNENCINVIRIIKESIDNATKYSNGNIVTINVVVDSLESEYTEENNNVDMHQINFTIENNNRYNIIIKISDNGDGFTIQDDNLLNENNLYGISLMRKRTKLLNGTFNIESTLGMGTTVTVVYQT
jgi:hypothetical protein